jgi:hypothetical protein
MARSKRRRVSHRIAPLTASSWENKNKRGLHGRARAFPHDAPAGIYMVYCLITGHGMAWSNSLNAMLAGAQVAVTPNGSGLSVCVAERAFLVVWI